MKRINLILKDKKINYGDIKDKSSIFKNVLMASINLFNVQSQGLNISQQREAIKVMDAVEDCKKDILELEDAQYTFLKNVLDKIKWPDNIRLFVAVVDSFENPIVEEKKDLKKKDNSKV